MNFHERLSLVRYDGTMLFPGGVCLAQFTDPVTKSTFSMGKKQTLGAALQEFIDRWEAAVQRHLEAQGRTAA